MTVWDEMEWSKVESWDERNFPNFIFSNETGTSFVRIIDWNGRSDAKSNYFGTRNYLLWSLILLLVQMIPTNPSLNPCCFWFLWSLFLLISPSTAQWSHTSHSFYPDQIPFKSASFYFNSGLFKTNSQVRFHWAMCICDAACVYWSVLIRYYLSWFNLVQIVWKESCLYSEFSYSTSIHYCCHYMCPKGIILYLFKFYSSPSSSPCLILIAQIRISQKWVAYHYKSWI